MLQGVKRRISTLERSIRPPATADRFLSRVEVRARLTGMSFDAAFQSLAATLSDEDLERLIEELEQAAFGVKTPARDAAKRKALILPEETRCDGPDGIRSNGAARAAGAHYAG